MRQAIRKLGGWGNGPEPYDERTFRYLLTLEQRRADRSGRPFVLIIVDIAADRNGRKALEPGLATTIFTGLSRCLRDTDFVGWYEDGHRAGAVLTELGDGSSADVRELLNDKVMTRGLLEHLPSDLRRQLQIQVSRYPALGAQ